MQEINLYHLLKFYVSKWKLVLALTIAGLAVGFCYNVFIQVPMYKSSATLILINPVDKTATTDITLINNYIELFKSRRVLEPVIADRKFNMTYDDLLSSTNVTNTKSTAVIDVAITSDSPFTSQSLVKGAVASFKGQSKLLYTDDNIQVVDNASFDAKPYNVNTVIQLIIPAVAGFIISIIGLFFAFDIKQNEENIDLILADDSTEAEKIKHADKVELRKKQIENIAKRKKEAEKLRLDRIQTKKLARDAKQAKRIAAKKATARRKKIAKKARIAQISAKNNMKKIEIEEKLKLKLERKIEKKKSRSVRATEKKAMRKIRRTIIGLNIKSALLPLKRKIEELKSSQNLKHEARQAEREANHEARMAKIESMKTSSLEKRLAAINRSKELVERIEKENAADNEKTSLSKKQDDKTDVNTSVATQSNGSVFYASIESSRLNRRGMPYKSVNPISKTKRNMFDRLRRKRTK